MKTRKMIAIGLVAIAALALQAVAGDAKPGRRPGLKKQVAELRAELAQISTQVNFANRAIADIPSFPGGSLCGDPCATDSDEDGVGYWDRSGDWLYGALYEAGFANQPNSDHRSDGLKLTDCYITAAVHCAPPANKPKRIEFGRCRAYLVEELQLFRSLQVVIVLGKIAFDSFLAAYRETGAGLPQPRPKFAHGAAFQLHGGLRMICSYHPSQQNTFTGKLTRPMFQSVFAAARASLSA